MKYSSWTLFDGNNYAAPWAWGPTGLMYDTDVVADASSWNTLWHPELKGRVAMWDDISMIWTTALSLGYKNVYNLTRPQLKAVKEKLLAFNRQQSALYYGGSGDEIKMAKEGKLVAFNAWYDPSERIKKAGKNFKMVIPREGAVGMFDSYMISRDVDHPGDHEHTSGGVYPVGSHRELVHHYINHQLSPEIQQEMVRITGLAPANIEALALLSREEIKALHLDEPDYFDRMLLWDHMPRKNLYQQVLDEVRADRKQIAQ